MLTLDINGKKVETDAEPDTPLLWVLRDHLGMTGSKYGCGMALCGACTVHVDGKATRSCVLPVSAAAGDEDHDDRSASATPRSARPCRTHGSQKTCRSAATASPARS